jgi:BBSome-interacting protein 1
MSSSSVSAPAQAPASKVTLQEVLPKAGLVYSEKGNLSEVLCKPKIMPIKSSTLEKLEALEAQAAKTQPGMPSTAA